MQIEVDHFCLQNRASEDRYTISQNFYAVYDGHSLNKPKSNHVVDYVKENFNLSPDLTEEEIKKNFITFDDKMKKLNLVGGSTAACLILSDDKITVANIGDSKVIIFDTKGNILLETVDHKPESESERIRKVGGFCKRGRVGGILAMSRSFGDFELKGSVIAEPDVVKFTPPTKEFYFLLGTDGLFDGFRTIEEIIQITLREPLSSVAEKLAKISSSSNSRDDATVIVGKVNKVG